MLTLRAVLSPLHRTEVAVAVSVVSWLVGYLVSENDGVFNRQFIEDGLCNLLALGLLTKSLNIKRTSSSKEKQHSHN
jgi:hypothetical protein